MDKYLIFGGVNSRDYGVWISGSGTFKKPSRRVEKFSVPGRNGDLTIDSGTFENVIVSYPAFISRGFEHRFHDYMAAMLSVNGYGRLEDNYDVDHYRMGLFLEPPEPEVGTLNRSGQFTLNFDCQPQRWLKRGEKWIEGLQFIQESGGSKASVINPTKYKSLPLIKLYGTGWVEFSYYESPFSTAGWQLTIDSSYRDTYINIDSEIEECYYASSNVRANEYVTSTGNGGGYFPKLAPNYNYIRKTNGITDIQILPRWWEI